MSEGAGARAVRQAPAPWLVHSLLAIVFWGLWGFQSKLAGGLSPIAYQLFMAAGLIICLAVLSRRGRGAVPGEPLPSARGAFAALGAGLLGGGGNMLLFAALGAGGLASVIYPFTALYPLVTVGIAMAFLGERLGKAQVIGLVTALPALFLLSLETTGGLGAPLEDILEKDWFWLSSAALAVYGLSGAAQKLAADWSSPARAFGGFVLGNVAVVLAVSAGWAAIGRPVLEGAGLGWGTAAIGLSAGILNALGILNVLAALRKGGAASVVVPLTGLYTLLTLVLAVAFLAERPAWPQMAGAFLAVISGALLAMERRDGTSLQAEHR